MIIGKLKEIEKYKGISKNLDLAIESIEKREYLKGNLGRNEILNEEVFFVCDKVSTREEKNCLFETHKKYIDIQIPIDSEENYGVDLSVDEMELKEAYNEEKDYSFYLGEIKNKIKLTPLDFILFLPGEPHIPLLMTDRKKEIKKVIYKIKKK